MANGGEGSSTSLATSTTATTLDDVMRAPAVVAPDVVVLDTPHEEKEHKRSLNPKEDLWLTSADGRYSSPIIPLSVGTTPHSETFYVHRNILLKAEYFRKALCGEFRESEAQAIDLPEEDPAIFHFIVAFLYEDKYVPILPVASVLAEDDKGKGVQEAGDNDESAAEDSDSSVAVLSDSSTALSRRRRERRRRRQDRHWERLREKHPGVHRPGCACHQCLVPSGPPCWNCGAPRPPPPPPPLLPGRAPRNNNNGNNNNNNPQHPRRPARADNHHRRRVPSPPPLLPPGVNLVPAPAPAPAQRTAADNNNTNSSNNDTNDTNGGRISGQDLRTWLLALEQSIDVYICANKFLLDGFKQAIARVCIDMLETAGADAAQLEMLELCRKLYGGLPESDRLLRMVFARVGFLQPHLFRRRPREALEFLHAHPEVSALLLREMGARREEDLLPPNGGGGGGGLNQHHLNQLPPMERPVLPYPLPPAFDPHGRPMPPPMPRRW